MPSTDQYTSNLAEFIDKTIKRWAKDKKKTLEPKLQRNFEAVTNLDYRSKSWKKGEGKGWRSTTWIGHVRVKVWSFFAVFEDIVLKAGKIPFSLQPSAYDEQYMTPEMLKDRDARLEKMTAKITSQLKARKADREYMKKWLSMGYYGMAFSAFNIEDVENVEYRAVLPDGVDIRQASQFMPYDEIMRYARYEMVKEKEAVPGHRYVSVWNMVWDMDADGLQPDDGSAGYAERIKSCPYDLRMLEGPGYIKEPIERIIQENRDNKEATTNSDVAETPGKEALFERSKTIDRFAFYMRAPIKYVEEFEADMRRGGDEVFSLSPVGDSEETENSGYDVEIMGEIANKHIIRLIRNDTGKRPHKMGVVEQDLDETTGRGIADNMESVQASLNGMVRSFEDNKKLSANVTTAVKARYFSEPGQLDDIEPGKKYDIADECDDVRKAIMPILFPDVGESLMTGIGLMMQFKDDVSMIPTIMQGFTLPKQKSDTAYEMRELKESAGKYIGQAIRNDDEQFIEPEIDDIYEYNMLYGDDESCKVNCKVVAGGFTSFQNKEIRGARMQQALSLFVTSEVLLPYVKVRPHLEVIYESMDEDPDKFIKDEEEMAREAEDRARREAQAKQEAIQETVAMTKAQVGIETGKDVTVKATEHKFNMQENAQQHRFKLEEKEQELFNKSAEAVLNHFAKDSTPERGSKQ